MATRMTQLSSDIIAFSETVFLSQHAAIKTCWVGVAAWCHMAPSIASVQGTPKKAASCHSSPPALPCGQSMWSSRIHRCCVACLQGPFDVTCKHPAGKWKCSPSSGLVCLCVACSVSACDYWGEGLTSELFINTVQLAQVGPAAKGRKVRSWGVIHTQCNKSDADQGELGSYSHSQAS